MSDVGPPSNAYNTRDGVRNNTNATSVYEKDLSVTSKSGTRSGIIVTGGTLRIGNNLTLDFQSQFYAGRSFAALWSQGGLITVDGTSTISTTAISASMPAVMASNSTVTLNGLTTVKTLGIGAVGFDVQPQGIVQLASIGNTLTSTGASSIGV